MNNATLSPFLRPFSVMAKPVGARCNLACRYCYYLSKEVLYQGEQSMMSEQTLELFIEQYIMAQPTEEVVFVWHGGEPLLRPLSFYQHAMALQQRHAQGHTIVNCLQTNGTLLDESWCRFLRDNHWLVGISIDGPAVLHDQMRRTRGDQPTHARVLESIALLTRYGVEWNAMAVVNRINADHPVAFYRFFKEIGCQYLQLTPIVELDHPEDNVSPQQWGQFCIGVYEEWIREDVGKVFVQLFDATLAGWMGVTPGLCTLGKECGHALVMEWNGDVYSCDHFVFPQYRLGNIHQIPLVEMASSQQQDLFGRQKAEGLSDQCRHCRWLHLCHGECPKNRIDGTNYLCDGYRAFFEHSAPDMLQMAEELSANMNLARD